MYNIDEHQSSKGKIYWGALGYVTERYGGCIELHHDTEL